MTVDGAINCIGSLVGGFVEIEGYIGHMCDWEKIDRGVYEETWIATSAINDGSQRRIRISSLGGNLRPFQFYERTHGTRAGCVSPEVTEPDLIRICGMLEKSSSQVYGANLVNIRWCELHLKDKRFLRNAGDPRRSGLTDLDFVWHFNVVPNPTMPTAVVPLSNFLQDNPTRPQQRVRVSGVAVIECLAKEHAAVHVLTASLDDEKIREKCVQFELTPFFSGFSSIFLDVDVEDRFPNFRVFQCIIEGDYVPEPSEHWVGKFTNLEELTIIPRPLTLKYPIGFANDYISFPKDLLRPLNQSSGLTATGNTRG